MNEKAITARPPSRVVNLLGISHQTAPVEVLERLALNGQEIEALYERFENTEAITDALVISTCNRTEFFTLSRNNVDTSRAILDALTAVVGRERIPDKEHLIKMSGADGVKHLFRVACGLESMVLGETQILGQLKAAYEVSRSHRAPSSYFERMVRAAFKTARRSRSNTNIGQGAVSIPSAAVHLATRIYSDVKRRTVVVVGAGETGRMTAEHFAKHHPQRLVVINRTTERAEAVAAAVEGEVMHFDQLPRAIASADILACVISAKEPLFTRPLIAEAMKERTGQPLAILDLGLPRNVAPEVDEVRNVFLQDLDALRHVVDANLAKRRQEVPEVEKVIKAELQRVHAWQRAQASQAGPLITALREAVEGIRQQEVNKAASGMNEAEREAVDRATRAVVNKLLHGPMSNIKRAAHEPENGPERMELIRSIFSNLQVSED